VAAIDALRRDLIVDAPSVLVTYPTDFDIIADGYQRATGWLVICMVCSATLLGVAFIAASLDVGAASRAFALAVRVTSPPRSVLTRAHLYATAVPPIIGTLLGVSLSVLGGRVIASSRGFALPWAVFGWLLIAGLICACIAAVITAPFGTPSGPGRRRE
jgi:hypothetical protein